MLFDYGVTANFVILCQETHTNNTAETQLSALKDTTILCVYNWFYFFVKMSSNL